MFGLLKPAWQSSSAEKRLRAIQKLDEKVDADHVILLNLAYSDPNSEVQQSAINRLSDSADLLKISQTHSNKENRSQATTNLHQLLGAKSSLTETEFQQLYVDHDELKFTIATLCPHATVREEIIESLNRSEKANIIGDVEYTDTRQLIAHQLNDIEALEVARKLLKGKDKTAEKIIRTKLNEHQAAQRLQKEQFSAAKTLCEKMEYIANHDSHPDFQAMFSVWSQRWDAIDFTPNAKLKARYLKAYEQAKLAIAEQDKLQAVLKNQQSLVDELQKYCHKVAALSLQELNNESDNIKDTITLSKARWNELLLTSPHKPEALERRFSNMEKALLSLDGVCKIQIDELQEDDLKSSRKAVQAVKWPTQLPELNALQELIDNLDELGKTAQVNKKESATKLDQLHKRINRLLGSTNRGNIRQAKHELVAVTKASSQFSGHDKAALDDRLLKASDAVSKMGDWKDFATEPKFLELCDAMDKLVGIELHPDALAKKISELQKAWKALGYSDCADEHWDRFKTAGDKAYEPCSIFFADRHETRKKNLEKREPLVTQMQMLLENTTWDDATDHKSIEIELRQITQAWQKIKDVERGAGQKQWDRLSALKSAIYAKLDVVYDANIEDKLQLVEQTKTLLEADVKDDTLNKLKLFQSRWKQIGVTRRKQDQAAWKEFKAASDAVFEKVQASRKSKRAEDDEHLSGYRDITHKIRQLGKSQLNLNEADKSFEQLQTDYQALPKLPKGLAEKVAERLNDDFKKACDIYNTARLGIKESEQQQAIDALSKKAALCTELEKSDSTEEIERLNNELDAIEIADNELKRRFASRLKSAQQTDRSQANQARKQLCLDLEILLNVDSPAEDKALRMQVQLDRMKGKGLGHVKDLKTSLEEFKLDWLCLAGADPELQASLEKRFQKALKNTTLL